MSLAGPPAVFRELCDVAAARGMHVELHTDHRSKNARGPEEPTPRIDQLVITDGKRRVVCKAPTGLRNLDYTASRALAELPR